MVDYYGKCMCNSIYGYNPDIDTCEDCLGLSLPNRDRSRCVCS